MVNPGWPDADAPGMKTRSGFFMVLLYMNFPIKNPMADPKIISEAQCLSL